MLNCAQANSSESSYRTSEHPLLNDTIFEGDNWTPARRKFQLDAMFHGRVASVSNAFQQCVIQSVVTGTNNFGVSDAVATGDNSLGPYYYCNNDPHKNLSKTQQAHKALHASRNFYNVQVKYEPEGDGNAHHHGGGTYSDPDQYFHWSEWFDRATESLNLKVCSDSKFCIYNPSSRECSADPREDENKKRNHCRWEAYPSPYAQAAGIAWHEVMHHNTYGHGDKINGPKQCGTQNVLGWHFQRNTMPYIVGECINNVIQRSQIRCSGIKAGSTGLRLIKDYNQNDCEVVEDPMRKGVEFVAQHSNKCLDVYWSSLEDGANLNQWSCNSTGAQHFTLRPHSSGYYQIENRTSGKCLEVKSSSRENSANVMQNKCSIATYQRWKPSQMWKLRDVGNDYYMIEAMHSGKCLDVRRSGMENGVNVAQWSCSNTTNQRFKIRGLYHSKDFGSDIGEHFYQVSKPSFDGIVGKSGVLVDSFGLLYNKAASKTVGGSGGSTFRYICPTGTNVIGIHGRSGARIDSIGIVCANSNHTRKYTSPSFGGNGGSPFNFTCHKGFKVKRVQGLSDYLVNKINISCGK